MTLSSTGTPPSSDACDTSPLLPLVRAAQGALSRNQSTPLSATGQLARPLQAHLTSARTTLGMPAGLGAAARTSMVSQHLSPNAFAQNSFCDTFDMGSRSASAAVHSATQSWVWRGREEHASTGAQAPVWAPPRRSAPAAQPLIVPSPTLGVVAMAPQGAPGPQGWPQFNTRLGELCYLSTYPGDKRRDRCAQWLRGQGPIDGMGPHDISEMYGGRRVPWLVSPTVVHGQHTKKRYAINRRGQWHAALEVCSVDAVLRLVRREIVGKGLYGIEDLAADMAAGLEPLAALKRRLNTAITVQHFAHSLVFGECFGQNEVVDLINWDGKLYGITTLHMSAAPEALLTLEAPMRKTLARRIFFCVAKILRDMHAKDAVHFNVHISDLLFLAAGTCTLGGFLSAHFIGANGLPPEQMPTHPPPELAMGQGQYDRTIDVWGLGMTLMRILCGSQPFLAAADVPHEGSVLMSTWHSYISWHNLRSQGVLRPEPITTIMLQEARALEMPVSEQLACGMAAASAADHELATLIFKHMLAPRPEERLAGDPLVTAAALLHQAVTPQQHSALDDHLKGTGILAPVRPDILARMGRIHDSWVQDPLPFLPPPEAFRRPSNG